MTLLKVFLAGFLGVIVFHQVTVALLNAAGILQPSIPVWSLDPVPPFSVPTIISKAFWGGVWALVLNQVLARTEGAAFWGGWIALGAIALPLVAIFVVPPLKGMPIPHFMDRFPLYALINAMWGLGTAVFLKLFGLK